ncbi:hypothetical protein FE784_00200 [Paenibacillus hemerocallicola]|uniref:Uncharacterized protein n=1 Tax=Paenibacillus hemerocallicola TaxID=1172614 RepID=A0A5C4TG98_9BACL|nr:hypothetical protein [Paenibacillus hemerocallicola]TNJ68123.1 hypothetical protein FE784_00200 [Paenibacillus hemerocallicola]
MKLKRAHYIILAVVLCLLTAFAYKSYFSNESILERAVQKNGYDLFQKQRPVSFEFYFDPQWIPKTNGETEYNIHLGTLHNTEIYLDKVIARDRSIYIGLNAIPHMRKQSGEFLYIWDIKDNQSSSTYNPIEEWHFFDKNGESLKPLLMDYGSGEGPDNMFGIEIDKKYMDIVAAGIYFKYSGFILYEYRQKKTVQTSLF